MIKRETYLHKLISFKDKKLIKIITGIRRCGKSTLFQIFKDYLIKNGIENEQIIIVNFEDADFENLLDRRILYNYLKERLLPQKTNLYFP